MEQLEKAYETNLDAFFITNHNTINGYSSLLEYRSNHEKYKKIKVYPNKEEDSYLMSDNSIDGRH